MVNVKNLKKSLLGLIIILMCSQMNLSFADNTEIVETNHHYPIYNLLTLTLNNVTNNGIPAQIVVFNDTLKRWELNQQLLDMINSQLSTLPEYITDLEDITIYEYNDSYLPGELYLILSPKESKLSYPKALSDSVINYILSHKTTWWYVANLTVDYLDLDIFDKLEDYYNYYFDSLIEWINIFSLPINGTSLMFNTENSSYDAIIEPYVVNGTFRPSYPERNNITACTLIYNGTAWEKNEPFLAYYNETLTFLNSLPLFQETEVTLSPPKQEFFNNSLNVLNNQLHLDPNAIPENLSEFEIAHLLDPASLFVDLDFPETLDRDIKSMLYFTIFRMFLHFWFVQALSQNFAIAVGFSPSLPPIILIALVIVILIVLVTIIFVGRTILATIYPLIKKKAT